MATDATGTPTALGIPTYETSQDLPSGVGLNNIVAVLDTLITARIAKAMLTTTGDIIYASGASTPARLAVGTDGQVLTSDGSVPVWETPTSGGMALICTHTVSVAQSSIDTNTVIGGVIPTTYKHLKIVMQGLSTHADTAVQTLLRFNNDATVSYYDQRDFASNATPGADYTTTTGIRVGNLPGSTATKKASVIEILIPNYNGTVFPKSASSQSFHAANTGAGNSQSATYGGFWDSTAAITRLAMIPNTGNFDVGTVFSLYGLQ